MDFERSAIKTLFYDFPIETAVTILENKPIKFLKDYFSDITRWRDTAFTVSEWKMLENILNDSWLGAPIPEVYPQIGRMLNVLNHVGKQTLTIDNKNKPRVRFNSLFRWRDIAVMLGEDAVSLAYLAKHDLETDPSMPKRTTFIWGDVLPHDNKQLNQLLGDGVADIHHHFNASADIFHINWIYLMNSAKISFTNEWLHVSQAYQYHPLSTKKISSTQCQCIAAAYLREMLYRIFIERDNSIKALDNNHLTRLLIDQLFADQYATKLQGDIMSHHSHAFRTKSDNYILDYAIPNTTEIELLSDKVELIYHGERNLMYQIFSSWFNREERAYQFSGYFYLYLLLKSHIRREYVETNQLHGFENFEITQARKTELLPKELQRLTHKIIVQSEFGEIPLKNYIETRIAPNNPQKMRKILKEKYGKSALAGKVLIEDIEIPNHLSFVVHFLKEDDTTIGKENIVRYAEYRERIRRHLDDIINIVRQQQLLQEQQQIQQQRQQFATVIHTPRIVGIDAAGSELKCRPEIFGHLFRYAAKLNILGRTYHVGEDFYDLADGLRAIDEAILFLQLDSNSRIGHALALSVDAEEYYTNRHYKMLISKQALLDNCVWLYYQAKEYNIVIPGELELFLQNTAMTQYAEIKYANENFDMLHYWHSMLLRGNEDSETNEDTPWEKSAKIDDPSIVSADKDNIAKNMLNEYLKSARVKVMGNKACDAEYPKQIVPLIKDIQKAMIREIAEKRISIECCPSSNVMIGGFERYDKHPIFTFKPIEAGPTDPIINVSINTDDRGIFATNISNEYSLITLAMMKMKDKDGHRLYNDETIYNYIERVRKNGIIQRFK